MDSKDKKYKILLTGGGTGGSVTPLLAVAEELNNPPNPLCQGGKNKIPLTPFVKGGRGEFEFLWLGTKFGVEQIMVEKAGIKFRTISGGKWRRYFSLKNLVDIFKIKLGFWQAFFIMLKWRPNLVMSAGSFISVPVIWAAWLLHVPVLIHQQDVRPGLANRLMAPLAKVVTVTFEESLKDYGKKAVWVGNPVRRSLELATRNSQLATHFKIQEGLPVVLVLGGGTGALAINQLVEQSISELTKFCQIIHVTGKNKGELNNESRIILLRQGSGGQVNYGKYEFLDAKQIAEAMTLADVAVTRAGMGILSELSYLEKPAIIIPMPDSHQEENAAMFKEAAIVLEQKDLTAAKFVTEIKNLIDNKESQKELGEKMGRVMKPGANQAMTKIIFEFDLF